MSHLVQCELCRGTGRRRLTVQQAATVAVIGPEWTTTAQIAEALGTSAPRLTTLCNRLTALTGAGVLERRAWSGRNYQWRVSQQQAA